MTSGATPPIDAVIDTPILAAIEVRLTRAFALPAMRYRPLVVDGEPLGLVDDERAARLARFAAFRVDERAVALAPRLATPDARSAALAEAALALREEGALPAWRDEVFEVAAKFGAPAAFLIERGAARYLGVRTYAAHLNGVVRSANGTKMWFARRSPTKAVDPGLLDNLVGGGIAARMRVDTTLVKESWEEAGIPEVLVRRARPAGAVHVRRAMIDGLQRETLFVHDLDVPADFAPVNQDGEAVEHRLVDIAGAARLIGQTQGPDEVTLDASVVVLDYFVRRGEIAPDDPGFAALEALRQSCRPT
jgi:8-oxo-dGTP pyrophosphatase MutT (NUDIX family)